MGLKETLPSTIFSYLIVSAPFTNSSSLIDLKKYVCGITNSDALINKSVYIRDIQSDRLPID